LKKNRNKFDEFKFHCLGVFLIKQSYTVGSHISQPYDLDFSSYIYLKSVWRVYM